MPLPLLLLGLGVLLRGVLLGLLLVLFCCVDGALCAPMLVAEE